MEGSQTTGAGLSEGKLGAACGIAIGILFLAAFGTSQTRFTLTAEEALQSFSTTYRTTGIVGLVSVALLLVFAYPFFQSLRDAFKGRGGLFANTAALLGVVAFALLAVSYFAQFAGMNALAGLYAAETGAKRDAAVVTAEAVLALANGLLSLALMTLATGVLLFGGLMRNSGRFPNWLAYVGILSAVLYLPAIVLPFSILTLAAGFAFFILLLVWVFACAGYLWRIPSA